MFVKHLFVRHFCIFKLSLIRSAVSVQTRSWRLRHPLFGVLLSQLWECCSDIFLVGMGLWFGPRFVCTCMCVCVGCVHVCVCVRFRAAAERHRDKTVQPAGLLPADAAGWNHRRQQGREQRQQWVEHYGSYSFEHKTFNGSESLAYIIYYHILYAVLNHFQFLYNWCQPKALRN